jgi:hypothetical protein
MARHATSRVRPVRVVSRRLLLHAAVYAGLGASLGGCLTPIDLAANAGLGVAQTGTSIYAQGTLQAAFNAPMDRVLEAVRSVMDELQYPKSFEEIRDAAATVNFTQTDGSVISIRTRRSSPTVTGLSIRVGFWGDPAISRLIQEGVSERLAKAVSGIETGASK